jgi:RNA polymerase sigma-70 factor (ECF subfamily)
LYGLRRGIACGQWKMAKPKGTETSTTLLGRLALFPLDQAAWEEFVERYGPSVLGWCRRWGAQEADALDISQVVLAKLAVRMREFVYDSSGSFRSWLYTVARNAWRDSLDVRHPNPAGERSEALEALNLLEARDDLVRRLEAQFDLELLEEASRRVRGRVQPRTWSAYELTAVEGVSGADAAARLGMNVGSVFMAKASVLRMLREEIHDLDVQIDPGEIARGQNPLPPMPSVGG